MQNAKYAHLRTYAANMDPLYQFLPLKCFHSQVPAQVRVFQEYQVIGLELVTVTNLSFFSTMLLEFQLRLKLHCDQLKLLADDKQEVF